MSDKDLNVSLSAFSFDNTPQKCNLSFSFNFDFDEVNSNNSSDSETADLQIDVSEVNNYEPPVKHKRDADEEASVFNEMEEEIERQLDAKAAKTNLTATNVKNILKHVITNEHVMAMVQKQLHNEEDVLFEPKLTRAKAKELAATQGNIPWPITPVKKTTSEVQVLIEEELPEDSSDEEYNPEQDKQSDDDRETENSTSSDVESQPPTPANPCDLPSQEQTQALDVLYDPEGIFKIPGIPHVPTEEESIGQRTRSKLCLSETPLEQIEQAFVPPDITTDMYDWDCEIDEDWDNFLKEFTQPLNQDPVVEDDPEADPEYNILDDEEMDLLDKEELRADKAVKVTRKELNNLIAELFEFTDTFSNEEEDVSKKRKSVDCTNASDENNTLNCSMVDLLPVLAEPELPKLVNLEQRHLLATQLRQHVQLMAQHYVMTYMHPELHAQAKTCKDNLNSLRYLSNGPVSAFNAENLTDALKLISDWENKFTDPNFGEEFRKHIADEEATKKMYGAQKWKYIKKFHPDMEKIFVESKCLMYPQLLPHVPFTSNYNKSAKSPYLKSEENLLALGLEQFLPFVASKQKKFNSKMLHLMDSAQLINQYLVPRKGSLGIFYHIQKLKKSKQSNPVKHYFEKGFAPRTIHYITLDCNLIAPKNQPRHLLPLRWQTYLKDRGRKIEEPRCKRILNSNGEILKKENHLKQKYTIYSSSISNNHPLRTPVVNILPKILPAGGSLKATGSTTTVKNVLPDKSVRPTDDSSKEFSSEKQKTLNSLTESIEHTHSPESSLSKTSGESVNTEDTMPIKSTETENDKCTSVVSTKSTKMSKKSDLLPQLPRLREKTPRLAKMGSAQNVKMVTAVSAQKNLSNCNTAKSKGKTDTDESQDTSCSITKIDNEEEIAELMLASTTIKKDALNRKKAKQARELENIKRLLEAENLLREEEKDAKFAASYLQKLQLTLESSNPEVFRAVIKLFLDYNEKLDGVNQSESKSCFSSESESLLMNDSDGHIITKDSLAVSLYENVCDKLKSYPDLCSDLLLLLKPHQAALIGKSIEYMMLQKMNEFVNVAQTYFAKQPSRLAKIMQAITQLSSDPYVTLERVQAIMGPILKSYPLVMDLFLQLLPSGKPPESLFASHLFENLTCPLGPHDTNRTCTEDASELCESIDLPVPTSEEDSYGGDNCKCSCHNESSGLRNNSVHCVSCRTKFLNGRIYLQTCEGLRPAKITFPGQDEEKLENIARVSLKVTDKYISPVQPKQRRKSLKNDSGQDDSCQRQCHPKHSPTKDIEAREKSALKPRRGVKSPPKSVDQKKNLKRLSSTEKLVPRNKKMRITQRKSKKDGRIEKREGIVDGKADRKDRHNILKRTKLKEATLDLGMSSTSMLQVGDSPGQDIVCDDENTTKADACDNTNSSRYCEIEITNRAPWTRQEDMILLQSIKQEYSENSFRLISQKLGNRTVQQVKERCQVLLSLLEKKLT